MPVSVKVILIVLAVLLVLPGSLLGYLYLTAGADFREQRRWVERQASLAPAAWEEQAFCSAPLSGGLRLNQVQLIASHNSYHRQPDPLRLFLVSLVQPSEAALMRYSHAPLSLQLDRGVRSLELDVRLRRDRFEIVHVPLVGNRGHSPDFRLALRELRLWSERHPGHVPIVVLLELKSDWMQLDPALRPWTPRALEALDGAVREAFPAGQLLSPDRVRGRWSTLEDAVTGEGWPRLSEVLGTVMFILHEDAALREWYVQGHPTLEGRAMFTCSRPGAPDCAVLLHNDPEVAVIQELVRRGYLVRTRADSDLLVSAARAKDALASGAQILSTDFPPGEPQAGTGYTFGFPEGRAVRANPIHGSGAPR
jgi:hypothetical protein